MKRQLSRFIFFLIRIILIVVLPFIILIRCSVFFHSYYKWFPYPALLAGAGLTFLLLLGYFIFFYGKIIGGKITKRSLKGKAVLAGLILVCYCGYTLFYMNAGNAKSEEVRKEFTALHPILRVSVGTIVLLDPSMIVTDMKRGKEDYRKMGLKTLNNSLHYPQKDGYVHAVDLRTNDRTEIRNWLLKTYFSTMGFHTLRHVGTADHLHISLPIHENPLAK